MVRQTYMLALALGTGLTLPVLAQDAGEIAPETLTVRETIDPGPNVFVNAQSWDGAGSIQVFSADDFAYKGNLTAGAMGQMLISPDGLTAYGQSTFMKRITYGDIEHVLSIYDVETLSVTGEIILPPKAAMVASFKPYLEMSADGRFVYVLNATPAVSVTVVDVTAGEVVQEIPAPGCWGIYPALEGYRFSTICGDGTFATFDLGADGTASERVVSEPVFDVDEDPLFMHAVRIGDDLAFLSYNGNLYTLSDAGEAIEVLETVSITDQVEDPWAPGGYGLMAYSPTAGILFVTMHSEPYDGSHKNGSEEIWAYDVSEATVLYRTHAEGFITLAATDEAAPFVYGVNEHEGTIAKFSSDPEAKFVLKLEAEEDSRGWTTVLAVPQ